MIHEHAYWRSKTEEILDRTENTPSRAMCCQELDTDPVKRREYDYRQKKDSDGFHRNTYDVCKHFAKEGSVKGLGRVWEKSGKSLGK